VIDGLTGDQRFFLSFAQAWRAQRVDALRNQVTTDPHSPARFRILGRCPISRRGIRRLASSPATRCTSRRKSAPSCGERVKKPPPSEGGFWCRPRAVRGLIVRALAADLGDQLADAVSRFGERL
jgi:hypothetical protein